jgi:hypothetical protein
MKRNEMGVNPASFNPGVRILLSLAKGYGEFRLHYEDASLLRARRLRFCHISVSNQAFALITSPLPFDYYSKAGFCSM